jgi:TrmH family RNA methyltransferase
MLISSRANAQIKRLRRLRDRREREATDLFLVEGLRLALAAAESSAEIGTLVLAPALLSREARISLIGIQETAGVQTLEVTPEVFEALSPQGVGEGAAIVARQRWEALPDLRLSEKSLWVAANQVQHPGSLGTILRTLDGLGGEGMIVLGDSADPYDPTAVRASLGAIFTQRLARATFGEFAAWKQKHGYRIVGASPNAPTDYRAADYHLPLVLLLGSERGGLTAEQAAVCDELVSIPMAGRVDSHHVAVAAGVVLYEAARQEEPRRSP